MRDFEKILHQAQKILSCPICHRKYKLSEIILRGFFENIYLLNIICNKKHSPISMTVVIQSVHKKAFQQDAVIGQENIKNYQEQLNQFDGDFIKLWNK